MIVILSTDLLNLCKFLNVSFFFSSVPIAIIIGLFFPSVYFPVVPCEHILHNVEHNAYTEQHSHVIAIFMNKFEPFCQLEMV